MSLFDFGMNKRIAPEVLSALRDNILATISRNPAGYADSLIEMKVVLPSERRAVMELAELSFDPAYFNLTPQELVQLDFSDYFKRMRGQMKRIRGFRLPDGIVMWSRASSLLYGLCVELAPGIRPLDVIGPYVAGFLQGPISNTAGTAASKGE